MIFENKLKKIYFYPIAKITKLKIKVYSKARTIDIQGCAKVGIKQQNILVILAGHVTSHYYTSEIIKTATVRLLAFSNK